MDTDKLDLKSPDLNNCQWIMVNGQLKIHAQ